jgi:hypothetical protein
MGQPPKIWPWITKADVAENNRDIVIQPGTGPRAV